MAAVSSREHAPWALDDYGFRVMIAPSFADIFLNNCFKNGLLPIVVNQETISELFRDTQADEGYSLTVDLAEQTITRPDGNVIAFEVDSFRKKLLIEWLG